MKKIKKMPFIVHVWKEYKRDILILGVIFLLGLFLRLYKIDQGLIFGYDQARDSFRAESIFTERHFRILGPETDIPGVYHGVGYYYILAVLFFIFHSPVLVTASLAIINGLGIFLVYWCGLELLNNRRTALISSLLFTVSFEVIQYSRWLSNPSLGLFTILLTYTSVWLWLQRKKNWFIGAYIFAALSLHFQLFLGFLFFVPLLAALIYRQKITLHKILYSILTVCVIDSTFLVAEIKFKFQTIQAFGHFFLKQKSLFNPVDFLSRFMQRFFSVLHNTIFPSQKIAFFLIFLGICFYLFKKNTQNQPVRKFLLFWLLSTFPIFLFSSGALNAEFGFIAVVPCLIYIMAEFLNALLLNPKYKLFGILLICFIFFYNSFYAIKNAEKGSYLLSVQESITYGLEQNILDYIYQKAEQRPYSICTVTNPLFINTTWAYLFKSYGKPKYGYLPYWSGTNQTAYLGGNILQDDTVKPELRFLIFEPVYGMQDHTVILYRTLENYFSRILETRNFGKYVVEVRRLLNSEERDMHKNERDEILTHSDNILYRCYH